MGSHMMGRTQYARIRFMGSELHERLLYPRATAVGLWFVLFEICWNNLNWLGPHSGHRERSEKNWENLLVLEQRPGFFLASLRLENFLFVSWRDTATPSDRFLLQDASTLIWPCLFGIADCKAISPSKFRPLNFRLRQKSCVFVRVNLNVLMAKLGQRANRWRNSPFAFGTMEVEAHFSFSR